jgi:pimeloyl-ACP methyl ester carboxylesterase
MNILLHGFPEGSYSWHRQIEALGPDTLAPDQRGYTPGASSRIADYRLDLLAADILALMKRSGAVEANIAGHDWGAMVAWWLAMHHPERVRRLAILNVPHPAVMESHLRSNPRQMLRSWYAGFFQIPALPEALLRAGDFAMLRRSMSKSSRPGTFTEADFARYRQLWSRPGALTGMLNWYRAAFRFAPPRERTETRVRVPTLILWGERDAFLDPAMAEQSAGWCDKAELVRFPEAAHWVQHEEPARVNALLRDWFGS